MPPAPPPVRRPTGLEVKSTTAVLDRAARSYVDDTGTVAIDPARPTVRVIAAVSGTVDEASDRIVAGAFTRSLASRTPKSVSGTSGTCRSAAS